MKAGCYICLHVIALAAIGCVMGFLALPEKDKEELADKMKKLKNKELKMLNKLD